MNDGSGEIRSGRAANGESRLQWHALGHGDLVVDLVAGGVPSEFHRLLAKRFHVAVLDVAASEAAEGGAVTVAIDAIAKANGHRRCALVLRGAALPLAIRVLRERPALVEAVVLLAPLGTEDAAALEALSAAALPMLVLSGTRGTTSPPEAGSRFRARVGTCHYVLVYDAADTIETDRPEAVASVVVDFLVHREGFIVSRTNGLIHP